MPARENYLLMLGFTEELFQEMKANWRVWLPREFLDLNVFWFIRGLMSFQMWRKQIWKKPCPSSQKRACRFWSIANG